MTSPTSGAEAGQPVRIDGPDPFAIGERIGDAYRITGVLGRGGMGVVYEAVDLQCRRRVAIKATMWTDGAAQLQWEAQAAAAVSHPGLAAVHGLGWHRAIPYLVMERLYGVNLETHLAKTGRLELGAALELLLPLAEVLAALHRNGLAHRDVKPANIMLCASSRVVLVDFGIVVPEVEIAAANLQAPCGTPAYMAPEAVAGQVKQGQAHLLDVYGFGVVAHEMLAGAPPFHSDNFLIVLQQHLDAEPPRLSTLCPDIPPAVDAIVEGCLAKVAVERPSIESVIWDLHGLARAPLTGSPVRSVLIVDDDPDAIELIRACATARIPAARVRGVTTCEAALWQVRQEPPDLMFVDLSLPGMNGIDLCSHLHAAGLTRRISVVAVSALHEDWIIRVLRRLGVVHFLPKGAGLLQQVVAMIDRLGRTHARRARSVPPVA